MHSPSNHTITIIEAQEALQTALQESMKISDFGMLLSTVSDISRDFPKQIKYVRKADERTRCYDYAFDTQISHKNAVAALLLKKKLIKRVSAEEAEIIIYFEDGKPIHAGKYKNDKVESKWDRGPIFLHTPKLVPTSYGTTIEYYKILDSAQVKEFLITYRP